MSLIECGVSNLTKHINKLVPCSNIVTTDAKNDRLPCLSLLCESLAEAAYKRDMSY